MPDPKRLSPSDREFFQLVARAAFSNPFGEERDRVDHEIAGVEGRGGRAQLLAKVRSKVRERVQALGKGRFDVYLDRSHYQHAVSDEALRVILRDIQQHRPR